MFLQTLIQAINDLFAKFWLIVIVLLPIIMFVGWLMS